MKPSVLILGTVWAERHATAAGVRMWRLIEALRAAGHAVSFASSHGNEAARGELAEAGVPTHPVRLNHSSFDEWLASVRPDWVIFDRFMTEEQFSWRVRRVCPRALRILDTVDLHSLRQARQSNPENPDLGPGNETLLREAAAILRSDLSLIVSEFEMRLLTETLGLPAAKLHYLPLVTPAPAPGLPGFSERVDFCTIGNFLHAPNADAVRRLRVDLWPRIRARLPGAELRVYGSYAPDASKKSGGFEILGFAPDPAAVMRRHRVLLAPLRFGAGLKGKILEAWQHGLPVVTTPVGAEGKFYAEGNWGGVSARDDGAFVDAAITLYEDEALWTRASARGGQLLVERFDPATHHARLLDRLNGLSPGSDLWSALFWREQTRGTEFMSRWIELKNQVASATPGVDKVTPGETP